MIEVQRRLRKLAFHFGPIDGVYGPQTAAAVQAFQIGPITAKLLKIDWYGR